MRHRAGLGWRALGAGALLSVWGLSVAAWANSGGIVGVSGAPGQGSCSGCHTGGAPPTVTLSGPTLLELGQSATYTLDVVTGASRGLGWGISASSGGTLALPAGTTASRLEAGQVTQSATASGPSASVSFRLTADQVGTLTISAAGLSADQDSSTAGDGTALASLTVNVEAPPDLAGVDLAGVDLARPDLAEPLPDLAGIDLAVPADLAMPKGRLDEPTWACSCEVGRAREPGRVPLGGLLLAGAALVALRRGRARHLRLGGAG